MAEFTQELALPQAESALLTVLEQRWRMLYDPASPENLRTPEGISILDTLLTAMENGTISVVGRSSSGEWRAHGWVREALMAYVQSSGLQAQEGALPGTEMDLIGWSEVRREDRRIPAGSFLRRGAFVGRDSTVLPPSTLQLGASIQPGVLVDAHCMIGSCVRLERGVRVGCGTMIAGFLTPVDLLPVVLEEGVVLVGNCGVYGSVVIGEGTLVEAGTVIRSTNAVFDERSGDWLRADSLGTLRIPPKVSVSMGVQSQPSGLSRLLPVIF